MVIPSTRHLPRTITFKYPKARIGMTCVKPRLTLVWHYKMSCEPLSKPTPIPCTVSLVMQVGLFYEIVATIITSVRNDCLDIGRVCYTHHKTLAVIAQRGQDTFPLNTDKYVQ